MVVVKFSLLLTRLSSIPSCTLKVKRNGDYVGYRHSFIEFREQTLVQGQKTS
jgi:hypothetical protein